MQAVILAAGKGERLRPLTLAKPKPLIEIQGKPLLQYALEALPEKIKEIIIVTGYLGDQIRNYFGSRFKNKPVIYVRQENPQGMFHALTCARDFIKSEKFLVLCADDLYKLEDIEKCFNHDRAILVKEIEEAKRFGICNIDENGFLKSIVEKPENIKKGLAVIGVYLLTHEIFSEEIVFGKNGEQLLSPMVGSLAKKYPVKVERADFWFPIAFPEDIEKAEKILI